MGYPHEVIITTKTRHLSPWGQGLDHLVHHRIPGATCSEGVPNMSVSTPKKRQDHSHSWMDLAGQDPEATFKFSLGNSHRWRKESSQG